MGPSVFAVNIAVDFQPTTALVPSGVACGGLFWVPDAATRTLVAEQKTYVTDKEATLELSTFIKGADGGQYEVEVQSNVPGMLETRRWEWVAGGGPGPAGREGQPGAPARVHASSPLGSTQLQTTTGAPGEYIMAGNKMFGWQETSPGSGTYGWKELGVIQARPVTRTPVSATSTVCVVRAKPVVAAGGRIPAADHQRSECAVPEPRGAAADPVLHQGLGRMGGPQDRVEVRPPPPSGRTSARGPTG